MEVSVRRVAGLLGTLIALTILGSSAVAVALPQLAADLSLDTSGTAWVLAAFSLAFSIATAFFGRLADLTGLRTPLRIGGLLYALGSLLAAFSWSFPSLIVGRLIQGFGGGAVPVLAMGIVAARFPGPARARALGGLTAVVSIVSGSGPLIGGVIAELLSWRGVLALPAIALLLTEPVARIAPDRERGGGRMDFRGALLVAAAVTGLTLLLQSPATGLGPLAAAGSGGAAVVAGFALVGHLRRRPGGFIPRVVVRNRTVVLGAFGAATLLVSYIGVLLAAPLILAGEQGWRPLQIGLALVPAAVAGAVGSRLTGGLLSSGRGAMLVVAAPGSAMVGLGIVAVFHAIPALLVLGAAFVIVGFAGGQVAFLDRVSEAVSEEVRGVALGLFHLVFFTGGAVGAAALGGFADRLGLPAAVGALALFPLGGMMLAGRLGISAGRSGENAGEATPRSA